MGPAVIWHRCCPQQERSPGLCSSAPDKQAGADRMCKGCAMLGRQAYQHEPTWLWVHPGWHGKQADRVMPCLLACLLLTCADTERGIGDARGRDRWLSGSIQPCSRLPLPLPIRLACSLCYAGPKSVDTPAGTPKICNVQAIHLDVPALGVEQQVRLRNQQQWQGACSCSRAASFAPLAA